MPANERLFDKHNLMHTSTSGILITPVSAVARVSDESESFDNRRNDVTPFDHRADANVAARETLGNRSNDIVPNHVPNSSDVLRGQRVLIHKCVHCRVNVCRRRRGQRPQQRCLFKWSRWW